MFTKLDDGNIYGNALYLMAKTMVSCSFSLNKSCLGIAKITIINVLLMLAARWFGEREVHLTKSGSSAGGSRDEVAMDLGELFESGKHHIFMGLLILEDCTTYPL